MDDAITTTGTDGASGLGNEGIDAVLASPPDRTTAGNADSLEMEAAFLLADEGDKSTAESELCRLSGITLSTAEVLLAATAAAAAIFFCSRA